jgi:hypothetical protein
MMKQWWRLRPTFEIPLDSSRSEAIEKLRGEYERTNNGASFLMFGEYGELHLPAEEHRLWSPHLSFYVTEHDEQVLVRGRYAPRLDVWTLIWIVYLLMAFSVFFGLIIAYCQWALHESMWGVWVAIVGLIAIVLCYVVAHIGQQLSVDQMESLRVQLEGILRSAGVRTREPSPMANAPKVLEPT